MSHQKKGERTPLTRTLLHPGSVLANIDKLIRQIQFGFAHGDLVSGSRDTRLSFTCPFHACQTSADLHKSAVFEIVLVISVNHPNLKNFFFRVSGGGGLVGCQHDFKSNIQNMNS